MKIGKYSLQSIVYLIFDVMSKILIFIFPIVLILSLLYLILSQFTYNHPLYIELYEDGAWVKYENIEIVKNNVVYYDDGTIVKYPDNELKVYYEERCYIESKICPVNKGDSND